jgi:hypothetical protein
VLVCTVACGYSARATSIAARAASGSTPSARLATTNWSLGVCVDTASSVAIEMNQSLPSELSSNRPATSRLDCWPFCHVTSTVSPTATPSFSAAPRKTITFEPVSSSSNEPSDTCMFASCGNAVGLTAVNVDVESPMLARMFRNGETADSSGREASRSATSGGSGWNDASSRTM